MSRKSQMEMLGLALIVILISIAMLFVVRFVIMEQPEEHKKQYAETELASNFVSTLLKTTNPYCKDLDFTRIFQDVAEGKASFLQCNAFDDTNESLHKYLTAMLDDTFGSRNIGYEFTAITNKVGAVPIYRRGNCSGQRTSKQFPIPVDASGQTILYITLDICT